MHQLTRVRLDLRGSRHKSCSPRRADSRCARLLALAAGLVLAATPAAVSAKLPAPWTGAVVRWADADTVWIRHGRDEVKIRLHWADAPEIAHTKRDTGQAAGVAALEYVEASWPAGTRLRVVPRQTSYDRIVADLDCDGVDVALTLTRAGFAWCDPRYKPPPRLVAAEAAARKAARGLWDSNQFGQAVPPWEFRQRKREQARGARASE